MKNAWRASCKVGKFINEHKVEILVGAAICATGIGIAAATGYTLSFMVGGIVVAGAGSALTDFTEKSQPPRIPQVPPPSSKEEIEIAGQPIFFNLPKLDLPASVDEILVTEEGIWANGVFYSTADLMKQSIFESELAKLNSSWDSSTNKEKVQEGERGSKPTMVIPELSEDGISLENYFQVRDSIALVPKSSAKFFHPTSSEERPLISIPFVVPGKQHALCHIGWINGVDNTFRESIENGIYIQNLAGGYTIQGIYNCSHTLPIDLLEALIINYQGGSPMNANLLQKQWMEFHEANRDRPNAKFLQICHSQGTIHVKNGLEGAPQEIRDRVIVIAIAPGAVVPDILCFKSYNYASKNDFVYKCEPSIRPIESLTIDDVIIPTFGESIDYRDELIILEPHPDAPKFDHPVQSPTFQGVIVERLEDFIKHKGEYLPEEKGRK